MSDQRELKTGYGRELRDGAPAEPQEAWIEWPDGRRVECSLRRTGAKSWVAEPEGGAVIVVGATAALRLDRLPAGASVEFHNVRATDEYTGPDVT